MRSAHSSPLGFHFEFEEKREYFLRKFRQFVANLQLRFQMKAKLQMSSIWSRFVDWERHLAKLSQLGSTQATTPPLVYTPLHPPIRTELAILLISQQWNITQTA